MSGNNNRNILKPTRNSPNPGKFLKEMETLIPALKAKGIIPGSREEVRAMGEKGTRAAAKKAEAEHHRRREIIGRRMDEHMMELCPLAFRVVALTGWGFILKALGYRYDIQGTSETIDGCPDIACTRIYIQRRWFPFFIEATVKAERLVWEEPKPPKSRIIRA